MPAAEDLAALMSRTALRDRVAFERLYRATAGHLLGVAWRILRNRDRAEEVLQEAFINVWHGASGYNLALSAPMTWLINVVRNKAIDAMRSGAAERASTVELDEDAMTLMADPANEPQRLFERGLEQMRISTCMSQLQPAQRQALALAYYNGLVHTDIAQALGAPVGTAKAWVRRGLDRLKSCLEAKGLRAAT